MFALEIAFQDDPLRPEFLLVKRPMFSVGPTGESQVVIDEMMAAGFSFSVTRGIGRSFKVVTTIVTPGADIPEYHNDTFEGAYQLDAGEVVIRILALDVDLSLRDEQALDRECVRVFQRACKLRSPKVPAVTIPALEQLTVSFASDQAVTIGSGNRCEVRVQGDDIAPEHALLGYEQGMFWVEDLGSQAGTYLKGQQVAARETFAEGDPLTIGRSVSMTALLNSGQPFDFDSPVAQQDLPKLPALVSASEIARPARMALQVNTKVVVGRDPSCDLWLGAPHISRRHCEIVLGNDGVVRVTDISTNGTAHSEGMLRKGDVLELAGTPSVLNFGAEITVGICFSDSHLTTYAQADGAVDAFGGSNVTGAVSDTLSGGRTIMGGRRGLEDDPEGHRRATVVLSPEEVSTFSGPQDNDELEVSASGAAALRLPGLLGEVDGAQPQGMVFLEFPGPMRLLFVVGLLGLFVAVLLFLQVVWTIFH